MNNQKQNNPLKLIAPSKMVRVKLKYGSARVSEDCSKETIDSLNHLSEVVYNRYTEARGSPSLDQIYDENEFYQCDDCDQPDACKDFECAIKAGIAQPKQC